MQPKTLIRSLLLFIVVLIVALVLSWVLPGKEKEEFKPVQITEGVRLEKRENDYVIIKTVYQVVKPEELPKLLGQWQQTKADAEKEIEAINTVMNAVQ